MNNTRFRTGQTVRSTINEQGLTNGAEYVVLAVETEDRGIFGGFTTYKLVPLGAENSPAISVGNGHLVLTESLALNATGKRRRGFNLRA